ncbi:MAG: HEAT repeat domain-containing protein [Candidatus Thorarchaeota archaeon]|nr:HEAT repeat domain-containing protein [Candidatus Thorarchaeota archaeon]
MSEKDETTLTQALGGGEALRGLKKAMSRIFKPKEDKLEKALSQIASIQACKDAALTGDKDVRLLAVCRLGDFGQDSLDSLEVALSDESSLIRIAAAGVMAKIGSISSVEVISPYISDNDENVRTAAEFAVGWLDAYGKHLNIEEELRPSKPRKLDKVILESTPVRTTDDVHVTTDFSTTPGGMDFSLSVTNGLEHPISDVTIALMSYPTDSIVLLHDSTHFIPKIKSGETKEVLFRFSIDRECIEGEFIPSVTFFDQERDLVAAKAGNRFIRSFFDQLDPLEMTIDEYNAIKTDLLEWNREHVVEKNSDELMKFLVDYLTELNLFPIHFDSTKKDNVCMGLVAGTGQGRFRGIKAIITLSVVGEEDDDISKLRIDVLSDDSEVLQAAASELFERIQQEFINDDQ